MTKSELIEILARRQGHLKADDVDMAVKTLLEMMSNSLTEGDRIEIRGFGSRRRDRLVLLEHQGAGDRARGVQPDQNVQRLARVADRADGGRRRQDRAQHPVAAMGAPVGRRPRDRLELLRLGKDAAQQIRGGLGADGGKASQQQGRDQPDAHRPAPLRWARGCVARAQRALTMVKARRRPHSNLRPIRGSLGGRNR